mmetsp:Transcript_3592/g.9179  ORF Transcript_3592/g.9179 Transcript_3592/m.9179 type:complete len:274 (-) Transcript_3592:36-857(-)
MDALAGYGSDTDSDQDKPPDVGGLSGLLCHYSEDSDSNENENGKSSSKNQNEEFDSTRTNNGAKAETALDEDKKENGLNGHPPKRRRRWDNPNENDSVSIDIGHVLPSPMLSAAKKSKDTEDHGSHIGSNPFQSLVLFQKDYTTTLREKLSQQLQSQSQGNESPDKVRLQKRLEQLHNKFQKNDNHIAGGASSASSFAAHLKSQHDFGNPHLLKTIIDHFQISPLESHVGNSFQGFEYVDRLMTAEERARVAAANYEAAGGGGATAGGPGSRA